MKIERIVWLDQTGNELLTLDPASGKMAIKTYTLTQEALPDLLGALQDCQRTLQPHPQSSAGGVN